MSAPFVERRESEGGELLSAIPEAADFTQGYVTRLWVVSREVLPSGDDV